LDFCFRVCFLGIKNALAGGTYQALLFDELKNFKKEDLYEKVSGKAEGWRWLGVATSAILGGFVAHYSISWALILSALTTFSAGLFLLTIRPVKKVREVESENYLHILKNTTLYTKSKPALLLTIIVICIIFGAYGAADEFWALIYHSFGLSINVIGILVAIGYGLNSLAGHTIHLFDRKRFKGIEYILILVGGVVLLISGIGRSVLFIPFILISFYVLQIANIKVEAKLQHQIGANQRATIFSIKSFINELFTMFFDFVFGLSGEKLGVLSILIVFGSLISISTLLFMKLEATVQRKNNLF